MTDDRITWHLDNWAYWMRDRGVAGSGSYPGKASGGMGRSFKSDFDSMCDAADRRCADAVGAILADECSPLERQVVTHKHLAAVFRFERLGYTVEEAYRTARGKIGRGLERRGVV